MTGRGMLNIVFGDRELGSMPVKALSLLLLIGALICAWLPHRRSYLLFWDTWVTFTPDFISGALGLAIAIPLYARRIIPYPHHSVNGLLFFIVNLSMIATVIQIALGKGTTAGTLPAIVVITTAIALSWLGMRAAASLAWMGLLAFSVVNTILANSVWGMAGFGFVVLGFCGLLLQTSLNPSALFHEIFREYISHEETTPRLQDRDRNTVQAR